MIDIDKEKLANVITELMKEIGDKGFPFLATSVAIFTSEFLEVQLTVTKEVNDFIIEDYLNKNIYKCINNQDKTEKEHITWQSTIDNTPDANREIIARNPLKPVGLKSAAKQCKIMKFHPDFTQEQILDEMMGDDNNMSLWSYT